MDGTFVADVAVVVAAAVDFAVAAVVVETGGKDLQIGTCMDRKKIQTEMYQIDCFPFQLFQVRKWAAAEIGTWEQECPEMVRKRFCLAMGESSWSQTWEIPLIGVKEYWGMPVAELSALLPVAFVAGVDVGSFEIPQVTGDERDEKGTS